MAVGTSTRAAKSATKSSAPKSSTAKTAKAKAVATKPLSKGASTQGHPSWKDLIKECIVESESRLGVSRPSIKKFAEEKYKIEMNGLQTSQLNRAIVSGQKLGIFVLPKGPSGKVKLPPKTKPLTTKENNEPAAPVKKVAPKPKVAVSKPVVKKAAPKKVTVPTTKKVAKKPTSSSSRPGKKVAAAKAAKAKAKVAPKTRTRKVTV